MFVAVAAMAFASCQKEENVTPETISATLTMYADAEATKTYLSEDNAVLWGTGEAVQLYVGAGETSKFVSSTSTDAYDGAASASFSFEIDGITASGPYSLGGIYPASAAMSDNNIPAKFKTILPQTQNAEVGKYDPSAYVMVLKPETVETLPIEYTASFRRATALNKITLTNVAEDIASVEITVPSEKYLAGRRYFDLTTGESGEIYYDESSTITVNSAFTGTSIDVWFCSWGVELTAGEELTVTMKSATKLYKRTISVNENGLKFVEGDLNTLKINMASATIENVDDFSGEWLITGATSDATYAAKAYSSGNNLSTPVQITVAEDGSITEVDGLDQCKMTFTKVTEGDYEGMYTIQDAGGKYLYAASSSGNQLKGGEAANSANYYWTVECKDGAYSIVASKSTNRNVMQFNPNSGSPIFSCYSSASQTAIILYPYSNVKPDTTPEIVVDGETTLNVGSDGGEVTFDYTLKNLDGQTLNLTVSDSEMLSVSAADGTLTVTITANKGEAREATITLTCGEAAEVVLTVKQDAPVVDDDTTTSKFVKVTTAPTDWSGTYLIVYEAGSAAFDGELTTLDASSNYQSVTITNNEIIADGNMTDIAFEIAKSGTSYTIKSKSGYFIGNTANSNKLNSSTSTAYTNTITLNSDGSAHIVGSGNSVLRYNATSGQDRFRYFKSSTYTNQKAIHLYKLAN